jgi:GTPase Era involved in 16S rRNA processing
LSRCIRASVVQTHIWVEEFLENGQKGMILIGAANKLDLVGQRAIRPGEVENFRFKHQLDDCLEVSAKSGENIPQLFEKTARDS